MELGIYTLGDLLKAGKNEESVSEHQKVKNMVEMAKLTEESGND